MGEFTMPLSASTYLFVGTKPAAVLFGDERVEVKTWREVYTVIMKRCNQDERYHEMLMYLRNKASGKIKKFLSDSPEGMTRPVKIDESMYGETHYGSATMLHILTLRILSPIRYDYSNINIVLRFIK